MTKSNDVVDVKGIDSTRTGSALYLYASLATGSTSLWQLLKYELIMFTCSGLFGILGLAARRYFYRFILKAQGRNLSIGRNVCIRGGGKISIGNNVKIDDECVIDARGKDTEIIIEDDVLISGATVLRARNGLIRIGKGSSIGRNCIFGTNGKIIVGAEVLFGAFSYLAAAGFHKFDDPGLSVIRQGFRETQGITIGDGAWLGTRVTVLDGVDIGPGAVVGAHALVTRDVPEMAIAYGSPAEVKGSRPVSGQDSENIQQERRSR